MPDQSSEKDLRLAVLIDADNASRRRVASRVKSESLDTRTKPSQLPE